MRDRDDAFDRLLTERPATVAAAAVMLGVPDSEAATLIDEFVAEGRLVWRGEELAYPSPGLRAADAIRERLTDLDQSIRAIDRELSALPWRIDAWATGLSHDGTSPNVLHLRDLAELDTVWRERFAGRRHDRVDMMMPDVRLASLLVDSRMSGPMSAWSPPPRLQLIVPLDDLPALHEHPQLAVLQGLGLQVRAIETVPRWWVVTTDTVVVQDAPGGGFTLVQNRTVADFARDYFDSAWERSTAPSPETTDADALLSALATGLTVETAARSIGISARTAHRRLAELMEVHGAPSLFTLGLAWGRQPSRPPDSRR